MFRCILTVLSFTMSIPVVWVSFALQRKRDPIHWEYCAHDVTQSMSLLLRPNIIQYYAVNNIFPSPKWCWVKNFCVLECVIDMTSSVEDDGMSYIRCKYLHPPRKELHRWWYLVLIWCTCFSLLLSFSPCQSLVCFPWFSGWQTKASKCPVFLVSHHVLPHPHLSY